MALGDITVNLNLDGRDFEVTLKKADELVKLFGKDVDGSSDSLHKQQSVLAKWVKKVGHANIVLNQTQQLFHSLTSGIAGLMSGMISANANLERMNAIMKGLATEAITSDAAIASAANSVKYLRDMAKKAPFEISSLQDSFVKLKTAGLDPTNGSVQALVDSVARFGGDSELLKRASIAIQQMAGKGVISMEELRQQLGEAIPTAMRSMADGMGMSMSELTKVVSSGTLEATGAIKAMLLEMELSSGGAASEMMKTWGGLSSRFKTIRDELYREIGGAQGGFFEALKTQFADLNAAMESGAAARWARDLGQELAKLVEIARFLFDNMDKIVLVLKIVGAQMAWAFSAKHIGKITETLIASKTLASTLGVNLRDAYRAVGDQVVSGRTAIERYNKEIYKQNKIFTGTVELFGTMHLEGYKAAKTQGILNARLALTKSALIGVGSMAKVAGRAFSMMLGPIGAISMIIYEVVQAFDLFGTKVDELREKAAKGDAIMSSEEFSSLNKELDKSIKNVDRLTVKVADAAAEYKRKPTSELSRARLSMTKTNLEKAQKELDQTNKAIVNATANFTETATRQIRSVSSTAFNAARASLNRDYDRIKKDIGVWRKEAEKAGTLNSEQIGKEFASRLEAARAAQIKSLKATQIAIINQQAANSKKTIRENKKLQKAEVDARILGIDEGARQLIAEANKRYAELNAKNASGEEPNLLGGKTKSDLITAKYKTLLLKVSTIRAQLNDESAELAKALQQLANEEIKFASKEDYSKLAGEHIALLNQLKVKKELLAINRNIESQRARMNIDLKKLTDQENPYLKMSSGAKQLENALTKAKQKQDDWSASGVASQAQLTSLSAKIKLISEQLNEQNAIDMGASVIKLKSKTDAINKQLYSTKKLRELRTQAAAEEINNLSAIEKNLEQVALVMNISKEDLQKYITNYKNAINGELAKNNATAIDNLVSDWNKFGDAVENVWSSALDGVSGALTDLVMTGKADFESLTNSIIQMFTKIMIQKAIAGSMSGMGFGFAGGGVMGSGGAVALNKYAQGGVAKAKQPQVAVFGEGEQNEAFVPLPDGRRIPVEMGGGSSPPNVEVNIINQSGQQVSGEQAGQRFDGEKFVLDVVLKAVSRPGNFRSGMKGAVGNG